MSIDNISISLGREFTIENGGSSIRQFPFLFNFDNISITTFSQHTDDIYSAHPEDGMRVSMDNGTTWPVYLEGSELYSTSIIKLKNGQLFSMSYINLRKDTKHSKCFYGISQNNGVSWTRLTGIVNFPRDQALLSRSSWGGLLFHRTLMEMDDGSLQGTMYGTYADDKKYRCLWVKSTNMGASWDVVSTIAYDPEVGSEGFCEPVAARCTDGSFLCVMRTGSMRHPLYQCRSLDEGLTWSIPEILPGVNQKDALSVDPDLCLMTNGVLVLSYGRPGCKLLFSTDGCGRQWGNLTTVYDSTTSGYTGVREIAPGRLMVIGDRGANQSKPSNFEIWGRYVNVSK